LPVFDFIHNEALKICKEKTATYIQRYNMY